MTRHRAGLATVSFPKMALGSQSMSLIEQPSPPPAQAPKPEPAELDIAATRPGTPGGVFMRQFWHAVCRSQDLPAGHAKPHTNHERGLRALSRPLRNGTDRGPPLPTSRSADASRLR